MCFQCDSVWLSLDVILLHKSAMKVELCGDSAFALHFLNSIAWRPLDLCLRASHNGSSNTGQCAHI